MSHTRRALGPLGALLTLLLVLALATPAGARLYVDVASWGGRLLGQWFVHTLPAVTSGTPGSPR